MVTEVGVNIASCADALWACHEFLILLSHGSVAVLAPSRVPQTQKTVLPLDIKVSIFSFI